MEGGFIQAPFKSFFFSNKLSLAEQNSDIKNRKHLAIKLALEEWHHCLEGANHPFEVITDHRNLEHLREAKHLYPWSGQIGSRIQVHAPDQPNYLPEPILPPATIVSPIQLALDDQITEATCTKPALPGGPEGRIYAPSALRLSLMDL